MAGKVNFNSWQTRHLTNSTDHLNSIVWVADKMKLEPEISNLPPSFFLDPKRFIQQIQYESRESRAEARAYKEDSRFSLCASREDMAHLPGGDLIVWDDDVSEEEPETPTRIRETPAMPKDIKAYRRFVVKEMARNEMRRSGALADIGLWLQSSNEVRDRRDRDIEDLFLELGKINRNLARTMESCPNNIFNHPLCRPLLLVCLIFEVVVIYGRIMHP